MAKEFIYFAGTLPMLFFGEKPPVTLAAFDEDADRLMDSASAALLKQVSLYCADAKNFPEPVRKFYDWENALRNALLDLRKKVRPDAVDFKRNNPDFYSEISAAAAAAAAASDLLEAEKILDQARWNALENLSCSHYADFTMLAFYRIKLLILEKYRQRTAEAGNLVLEDILKQMLNAE